MGRKYNDFTGKEINGIKVIREAPHEKGRRRNWVCECTLCHEEYVTREDHLLQKTTTYCTKCISVMREDLTGQKFGRLTVKQMIPTEKYKRSFCLCDCDCGTKDVVVQANHLKAGEIQSCGCIMSAGEEIIAELLTKNSVQYSKQKTYPDLKRKSILRYDFYLPDCNTILEYNGIQHYEPVKYFGGEKGFIDTQERDKIKREYCIEHGIEYIVIRYDENIEEVLIKNNIIMKR